MRQTVIVSDRGQITLPKELRERLAIKPGSAMIAEERDGELVLRPALVTPVRVYSEAEIQGWLEDDTVQTDRRNRILKKARSR